MEKSFRRLTKPSTRHAFIEAEATTAIAHQVRVVRQQRGWTQHDLAKRMKTTQAAISRLEDPSYGRLSVKTLIELAKVFDVGLQVKFISLVHQFRTTRVVKREQLEVESFEEESMRVGFIVSSKQSFYTVLTNVDPSINEERSVFVISPPSNLKFGVTLTSGVSQLLSA